MTFLRRHRTAVASAVVLVVAAGLLVAYALSSNGYPVRQVDLNDGGVWVTSDADGLFGRLNKPAGSLDAAFYPPGGAQQTYQLDVAQDAAAVVARDRAAGTLLPVDVTRGVSLADQAVPLPANAQVQLAGGTVALLDPVRGAVWATRVDTTAGVTGLGQLDTSNAPLASVDGGKEPGAVALAVGVDGSVFVASATGKTALLRPDGIGFTQAEYGSLGLRLSSVRATMVGGSPVVLAPGDGKVVLPDHTVAGLAEHDDAAVPQQSGPDADAVLVATSTTLYSIALDGGAVAAMSKAGKGRPAAPVRLATCVHAAWAGTAKGYVRSCDGGPATPGNLKDLRVLTDPVFRVNRSAIVLNDLATGAVWDLTNQRKVDDWSSVKPPPVQQQNDKNKDDDTTDQAQNKPPKAVDDTLGARTGRTTVLHVLDNDSDPAGNILSVSGVTAPDNPAATVAVAPNGQTVQVTVPAESPDIHFKYTVDDGKGLNATAAVTVQIRGQEDNKPPEQRAGRTARTWNVSAGGQMSLPALADWRDFDGDPVLLVDATAKAGSASTTPDGFVEYVAPLEAGPQAVDYRVTDNVADPVPGSETVQVQPVDATVGTPATAEPDVARGQVGQPIVIRPLDNDLPGSDPTDPAARMQLAADVASPADAVVVTDVRSGQVTATASRPGTFLLDYTVAFGNAPFAKGGIRVDVTAAPTSPQPPVAMPDVAVVRGQQPATVDVLVNDFASSGGMLALQQAEVVGPDAPVRVAIVRGRWLRVNALAPSISPNPQLVRYTVTDGVTAPVTGEVTVTQLAAPEHDVPVPKDDYAVVRAGDSVTIPVLDNDTTPGGSPISLLANVPDAPERGRLTVTALQDGADPGAAYVHGNAVRFVPSRDVTVPKTVEVAYVAQNPAGESAVGHAHVTINPRPSNENPDVPPIPRQVEARVVAGDTATIPVPTSGVDPDGDTVTVTAVGSAPVNGRVLAIGATSITYQAYPTSAGTDTFSYLVTDPFGRTGVAAVRVAVVPPGQPQPPVAVDDVLTAAPGATLTFDVTANDLVAADDTVTVSDLGDLPDGVSMKDGDGVVDLVAPDLTGKPLVVSYALTNGIGDPSPATLTVRGQDGWNSPPTAGDVFAKPDPDDREVEVDVLAKVGDLDGPARDLKITTVHDPKAEIDGGTVTLPVGEQPRTVPYEVRDKGGATSVGLIHLPAPGNGVPYAKPDQTIEVPQDGTKTVDIADYVVNPAGKYLRLTQTDRIWASPAAGLTAQVKGEQQIVLTAGPGYRGPAAVTFEVVTDRRLDAGAPTAIITVPVQVGPDTPVLRCPDTPLSVIEGGVTVTVNVTSVCHVWVADRKNLDALRYTASWRQQPDAVELDGSGEHRLRLTADTDAQPGATGTIEIGVDGMDVTPATLGVRVVAPAAPSVSPVTVDGVKAGDTATVDLTQYFRSQLREPKVSVVSVRQSAGMPARASADGSRVKLEPGADSHGAITFDVVATDVSDKARADRQATGRITLNVLGVPDAPGTPAPGRTVLSRVVELSWSAPRGNGAPIDSYEVDYGSGTQTCPASPCTITGLTNGTSYTFTVRAHNLVGWGKPSGRSAQAKPNTVPGAVTGLSTSEPQDHALRLSWGAAPNEGTPVQRYEVSWTGGGRMTVDGGTTTATATGLDNDVHYTFTVIAVNEQGPGPAATVAGQSASAPEAPGAPTFTAGNSANASSRSVNISWNPVGANGPTPTTYTLTRTGGGTKTVCANVAATSCTDDGLPNDGTIYTYTVTAANAAAQADPGPHTSAPSPGADMEATATPDPITGLSATPTGNDGQATVRFDAPATHGKTSTVTCTWSGGSCGTWTYDPNGQPGVQETVNGLPNGQNVTLSLQACNGSAGGAYAGDPCDSPASTGVTTYGPIRDLAINTSANGTVVNFTVSVNPNGKPATVNIQTSRQNQTFTTGVGAWSWSGADDVGYSSSDTINVTVSDAGRASVTGSRTQNTPAAPPPPASVTVSKGALCGQSCVNQGCVSSCRYIHVQTANFGGNVTCTFNSREGNGGFVNQTFGANDNKDSWNFYGYAGGWVEVTCGGVTGRANW
ncbi:Ig-like domain-containing protein [Actinophytocola sp.]|uniref:Ig-like domain-containing protein n=1 Tax=Actinophytocola sp. TaxID=1872138 RepID=UPI002ED2FB3D